MIDTTRDGYSADRQQHKFVCGDIFMEKVTLDGEQATSLHVADCDISAEEIPLFVFFEKSFYD